MYRVSIRTPYGGRIDDPVLELGEDEAEASPVSHGAGP